jgi:octaprenyl-diphosphate synthase
VAHASAAREALADLAPSPFRDALAALAYYSVERRF